MDIYDDVMKERERQTELWGKQKHTYGDWFLILGEEFGEACEAAGDASSKKGSVASLRMELLHIAAVAVQIIEAIDEDSNDNL